MTSPFHQFADLRSLPFNFFTLTVYHFLLLNNVKRELLYFLQ
jgi:hypothetical protein